MLKIHLQTSRKDDIELFFYLLPNITIDLKEFEAKGVYNAIFQANFYKIKEVVTIKENVTGVKQVIEQEEIKRLKKENEKLRAEIQRISSPKQDTRKNVELSAIIGLYHSSGLSLQSIAEKLNKEGRTNSRNKPFNKMTVQRLLKKYKQEQQLKRK